MSLESHLAELRKKHETLSDMVVKEERSPASDKGLIAEWKRKKLRLKEEINRLSQAH